MMRSCARVLRAAVLLGACAAPLAARDDLSAAERQQVREALRAASYHPRASNAAGGGPALVARNQEQRYQTTFRADAIEIAARDDWHLGVSLRGFGRVGDVRPLPAGEPRSERERVLYRRGPVTEWYVNRPGGLEQGFDVLEPPGEPEAALVLALAVDGSLALAVEQDAAVFSDDSGRTVVRYDGLRAWDATGRSLPVSMEGHGRELRLVVEARDARFPVTVDPTFRHEAQIVAPGGAAGDAFGEALAISGDTLVVGASGDDTEGSNAGAAFVFVRSGTTWALQQELQPLDASTFADFGEAVAIAGDTIVVGAPGDDSDGITNAGSAYVFGRSGTTWTQQERFVSNFAASNRRFGHAVACLPDRAVIGTSAEEAAYVFRRIGTSTWASEQRLSTPSGLALDRFGRAVAISGATIVVGAPGRDGTGTSDNRGGAYVWVRSSTTWTEQAQLGPLVPVPEGAFGVSVALDLDTAVVGTAVPTTTSGYADVFLRSGTLWVPQQRLQGSDTAPGDTFGRSVALLADTLVVGAPSDDTPSGADAGSAYVFVRLGFGSNWIQQQRLAARDAQAGDQFGWDVALSGSTALVGAPVGLADNAGSAYAYRLFSKGDINVDGQTDLLVRLNTTGRNEVWLMNGVARENAPLVISPSAPSLDWLVAGTDDFNRDRSTDLLLWNFATGEAEFWLMNGANRAGAAVPLPGALQPPWKPSALADFNNDGNPDIVYRNFATQDISIWTMNGTTQTGAIVPVPGLAAHANWEIVGAQDWNGDGATDFLWYNSTSGKIVLWYMDAGVVRIQGIFTNPSNAGANNWKVLAMGDYGSGMGGLPGTVDLVWRNATSGKFVAWHMDQAGNRTFGTFLSPDSPSPEPTDWTIVGPR